MMAAWENLLMRQPRFAFWLPWAFLLVGSAVQAVPAYSQTQAQAGVRAGVSVDPDQFYFGGHIETTPLVDRLRFRPNVEVGVAWKTPKDCSSKRKSGPSTART